MTVTHKVTAFHCEYVYETATAVTRVRRELT